MLERKVLRIRALRKDIDVIADRRGLKVVLGWLVNHAMSNGMTTLELGLDSATKEPWMKFYGPHWYRSPVWHDMVPPESYCYPGMLQICMSFAELKSDLPIRGLICASKRRRRLRLEFQANDVHSFRLSWPKAFAANREDYPEFPEEKELAAAT